MFKSAMGYLGGVASNMASDIPTLDISPEDALVGSIIDVGGHKVIVRKRVGEGGFAFVYKVEDVNEVGKSYALKRLLVMDGEKRQLIIHEISVMKSLSGHSNIVKFINAAEAKGVSQRGCEEFLVLMEYCPSNLSEIMNQRQCRPFPPATVAKIFAQITSAVAKMHRASPPIVHRDLKLENLLVEESGKNLRLCDFGSSTTEKFTPNENWNMSQRNNLEEEMAKHTTPMYRAPEMLDTWSNYSIHTPADVWALGCLLHFLCFGRHPFEDSAKLAIINGNYRIPETDIVYEAFHDLIRQMLVVDPSFRPSINQVQEHLASICSSHGFEANGELDLELSLNMTTTNTSVPESVSNESLSENSGAVPQSGSAGLMSSLRGGASGFMGKIRDTSKAVIQTVQQSMTARDLDLHLITERIAVMSYPAEGLESAMKNHIDEIAAILEHRHANNYSVYNLTERTYNVSKFATGMVSQPGWFTQKPTAFQTVTETLSLCLDFLRRDAKNVIVIHCLDGRSNSAVLVVALLIACGFVRNYKDGLKFFGLKRCGAILEPHHKITLRYLETAFSGLSSVIESRTVTVTSVVLEPVPGFSKTAEGCRPFVEVSKPDSSTQSPLKVAPSSDYASLAFFSSYDEEAILKVNAKVEGDVMISIFHARQTNLLFANKFEKILICRLYFHTGFLGSNSSTLRFKLRDLDGISGGQDRFATDFKVVVNFRPEKELKSIPLRCKNADLALLFGTRDEMVNNREMMGSSNNSNAGTPSPTSIASPQVDNVPSPLFEDQLQHPKAPPRSKTKESSLHKDFPEDLLIGPTSTDHKPTLPSVPCPKPPSSQETNVLLDFGNHSTLPKEPENQNLFSDANQDLFSDLSAPKPSNSNVNLDNLLDISNHQTPLITPMKTSNSAENFVQNSMKPKVNDPFDFLGLQPTVKPQEKKTNGSDDLVAKMLNDLDMKPTASKPAASTASSRPNYNVSFNMGGSKNNNVNNGNGQAKNNGNTSTTSGGGSKKVSSNTFEDLLGQNFSFTPSSSTFNNTTNKSIGEMKKAETMKTMSAEEAKVYAWKDGKSRNLRALLCSLHTVIWSNSRWSQCGMHQLVNESDVGKMYKKACLAVHPDKQMGTENEELSKLIFIELNDAWAEFNKDS